MNKIGKLSDESLEKIARDELNEDPVRRDADLKAIKEWIKKQPHLNGSVCTGNKILDSFQKVFASKIIIQHWWIRTNVRRGSLTFLAIFWCQLGVPDYSVLLSFYQNQ